MDIGDGVRVQNEIRYVPIHHIYLYPCIPEGGVGRPIPV